MKSNNFDLLKSVLTLLATQGCEKSTFDFADEVLQQLSEQLSQRFHVPLENAGVDVSMLQEDWRDLVDHRRKYLNLVQEHSQIIWWKLFNSSSSTSRINILTLFGHVECSFSTQTYQIRLTKCYRSIKSLFYLHLR